MQDVHNETRSARRLALVRDGMSGPSVGANPTSPTKFCPGDKCKLAQLPESESGFLWVRVPPRAPIIQRPT